MTWILLAVAVALLLIRAYRNTFDVHTQFVTIPLQKSARMKDTSGWEALSVLHLSDLHMENLSVDADHIVEKFSDQPIDLIAITGDLLDRQKNIPKAVAYVQTVMLLRPALGTFVVFGNHDYVLKASKLRELKLALEQLGCRVLVNEHETVSHHGQPLHIIGVDDFATGRSKLAKSFQHVPEAGARLVLTHDPNVVLQMKEYTYDYLLSGHFHGGQIHWPRPFHLAKMGQLPKLNMVKGLHEMDGRPFYISEGLGQTGVNIRLRSRPELTLHTLIGASTPTARFESASGAPVLQESAATLALE
ncbi:putative metallophosphoesterase YkoQ [Brevibacillus reuszeri]|uniref:Metallophosphoesterase n=1 Tax=Brevibacillus reuszeri TaxID=54915 RepID=A0A0K9YRT9_9BACL|nr:metallophosphoesterase [Brevibacillus reuszeri]KNB71386.1 metallophosphoesterase [Brevibacillus reuszeri]MED1857840.1 metallophosphoesterase [Brevibacillus reuszeri]GED66329.1 putative metallophosphoesterase YkoQ [Brevibacillus reuszeri]